MCSSVSSGGTICPVRCAWALRPSSVCSSGPYRRRVLWSAWRSPAWQRCSVVLAGLVHGGAAGACRDGVVVGAGRCCVAVRSRGTLAGDHRDAAGVAVVRRSGFHLECGARWVSVVAVRAGRVTACYCAGHRFAGGDHCVVRCHLAPVHAVGAALALPARPASAHRSSRRGVRSPRVLRV